MITQAEIQPHEMYSETLPTVSVIIPAYNVATYIGEAIKSVIEQTFTSHEIIVINDGSPDTDQLEEVLRPFVRNIEYIKQENRGAAAARNTGLRSAKGEFVAFLDADDTWLPDYLKEQIDCLRLANADVVYSDALLFGDSPLSGLRFMRLHRLRCEVTPESLLAVDVSILTSAVLARKERILQVGLFSEDMKRGHDFDLWWRLARAGARFTYQPKLLARHRILDSGLSGNMTSQYERTLSVLQTIKKRNELTASEQAAFDLNWNSTLAELAIEQGKAKLLGRDFEGALKSFKEAKNLRQNWKLTLVCLGLRVAPETFRRIYLQRNSATNGRQK